MISILSPTDGLGGIAGFMEQTPPGLVDKLELIDYSTFLNRTSHEPGIVVLGNYELLTDSKTNEIQWVCRALLESTVDIRIFNFPGEAKGRYRLLKMLKSVGINDFDVFRPDELDGCTLQYPVFLRDENKHTGNASDLLHSRAALDSAFDKIRYDVVGGRNMDLLVVEYCDTQEEAGIHRKYCAYRFGDTVLSKGINFDHTWMVKFNQAGFVNLEDGKISQERIDEDIFYARENPHKEWVMDVFKRAKIEYGRIDYGECKGKLQAWEINTHPSMGVRPMKKRTPEQLLLREKLNGLRPGKREKFRAELFAAMALELERVVPGKPVSVVVPDDVRKPRLRDERSEKFLEAIANSTRPVFTWLASWIPEDGWIGSARHKCHIVVYRFLEPRSHRTRG
ncbi:MAG: hypothetical protein IH951_15595 [Bacteroidetes bacterium]|nr:hypothetical protein [Bacteroidota bacterium]